jgi:RNA polymerase sigma factor (sigma-70 family)
MCRDCEYRSKCHVICPPVEEILPSMEQGRLDAEDLPRIFQGRIITKAILDNVDILTELQQQVVQLYYREEHLQREIAAKLGITQQGVNDHLRRIRDKIGKHLKLPESCPMIVAPAAN